MRHLDEIIISVSKTISMPLLLISFGSGQLEPNMEATASILPTKNLTNSFQLYSLPSHQKLNFISLNQKLYRVHKLHLPHFYPIL